jgi:hypothetical protein
VDAVGDVVSQRVDRQQRRQRRIRQHRATVGVAWGEFLKLFFVPTEKFVPTEMFAPAEKFMPS